jgi:hypothetical protein
MNKLRCAAAVAALVVAISSSANAAPNNPTPEEIERARTFFNAGAQAYGAAKYADAVRSFEQSYELAPRPPILFSLAQAERKEFQDHNDARMLKRALHHYKDYLEQVPTGGRRAEALEAKSELEGRLARLDPQQASTSVAPTEKRKPRVTVFSPTAGAQASLDGGPPQELPYFADLEPGRHKVRVFGEGYIDAEQEISGDKGLDVPVNLPLKEKPALVTIALDASAEIFVDGRLVAEGPLSRPIEVAPGPHVIAIAKNGKQPWSQEVVLERGKPFKVEPKLVTSGQRYIAYSMLGTGIASLAIGGIFALSANGRENRAQELEKKRETENLSADELDEHNRAIDRRDTQRTAAIVFASVGAAVTTGGLLFYFFNKPPIALLPPRSVEPTPKPQAPTDVTGSLRPYPLLGPGVYGAGLTAIF